MKRILAALMLAPLVTGCSGSLSMQVDADGKPVKNQRWEVCPVTVTGTSGTLQHSTVITVHVQAARLDKGCNWD